MIFVRYHNIRIRNASGLIGSTFAGHPRGVDFGYTRGAKLVVEIALLGLIILYLACGSAQCSYTVDDTMLDAEIQREELAKSTGD